MQIFINGRGSISAAGANSAALYDAFCADDPTWSTDEATGLPVYRINDLPANERIDPFATKRSADRSTWLALHAAEQAVTEAGWAGEDFAILVGCSRGPTSAWENSFGRFTKGRPLRAKTSPRTTLGGIGFALADYFGTTSLTTGMSVTCSSGFHALLHGVALLKSGMVDRVLVGGSEAPLTDFTLAQLQAMGIYASAFTDRKHACMPLQHPSTGMVVGEGAAFFALSTEATSYELIGYGFGREQVASSTGITDNGAALQVSMRTALATAGYEWADVVLHAPGTKKGDAAEQEAINAVMGPHGADGAFSKHLTGHTFGASGPINLDFALSMLNKQGEDRLLVNATGFGGNAVSVIVKKE